MVCALGSGKMAALSWFLTSGNTSQKSEDDSGNQELAAQNIERELYEANEANLIDEEDMHVFDLQPMTDPLHLVRCNACRKPIKTSQYAAHAELCRSLTSLEEIGLELDRNTGHKKPPRKERRKLSALHANQATSVGEQDKSEHPDGSDISAPEAQLDTTFAEAKNRPQILDSSGISPGNTNSGKATSRPRKRSKLLTVEGPPRIVDHFEAAGGVISQEALPSREYPRRSRRVSEKTSARVVGHQMPRELHECAMPSKDVPVPLATKIYYSQRNHRLRSALSSLYYNAPMEEYPSELVNEKVLQANMVPTLASSLSNFSPDQIVDDQHDKDVGHPLHSVHIPDQIHAQNSELYSSKPEGLPLAMNISNQFPVNNVLRPNTSLGKMTSNYFSNSYSFADSSGKPLRCLQQPKGSVSVV